MTNVRIVIGANFGDEGKGLMTAYFAEEMMRRSGRCLNVLTNGGAQRGHTVVRGNIRHVFRHFGSGTLAGADTYFPGEFILNPMIFMKEYRELSEKLPGIWKRPGHDPDPDRDRIRFFVHPNCPVTTPFEMLANQILEENRGEKRHGSVGVGIWETMIGNGKTFGQLLDMTDKQRLAYLKNDRRARLYGRLRSQGITVIPERWRGIVEDPYLIRQYLEDLSVMCSMLDPSGDEILKQYKEIIFENGQGLLLDRAMLRKGYGHHTTPSNTGMKNPARILETVFKDCSLKIEAVYVTRSYMTRHGAGRFDTECPKEMINRKMQDQTNQPNESQGTLRYGKLNLNSLRRRVKRDFSLLDKEWGAECAIAMTHLNEFIPFKSGFKGLKYKSFTENEENCVILKKGYWN